MKIFTDKRGGERDACVRSTLRVLLAKPARRWALPRGVQASLRNDEKSVSALRETLSDKDGKVVFSVSENESFEGSYVLSTEEYDDLLAENSAFYIVINDKTSIHYNSEYETVVLKRVPARETQE